MDISLNLIDLQYLTNPERMNKLIQQQDIQQISKKDLEFYKKRIFQLTKDLLRGEKVNTKVNKSFEQYANTCIEHFKFMDKMEIIQNDYKDIKSPKNTKTDFSIKKSNILMCRQKKQHRPKITDHIKIKTTKTIKPPILPKHKNYNLNDPKFRDKGLKKKNINNI